MAWVEVCGLLLELLEACGEALRNTSSALRIGTTVMRLQPWRRCVVVRSLTVRCKFRAVYDIKRSNLIY